MKRIIVLAALALLPVLASAQDTSSQAVSGAQSTTTVGASNQGVSLSNTFEASRGVDYSGRYRVEAVAPLALGGAAAGFSNENCANTTQGGLGTPWFSAAKGNAKESIRCNARRDAGVYVALAADAEGHGLNAFASKLRAMAWFQKCTATAQEIEACRKLGLITMADGTPVVADDYKAVIPPRPADWTNEAGVRKDMAPRH
jgi:hypothetical protein